MSDDLKAGGNTKPCAYCGSTMSATAILCPVCKSYQSSWRTFVVYVAGIAGLLGLIGSASVYIISEVPNIYRVLAWRDQIKIWEFRALDYEDFEIFASNTGDGPVVLSSLIIYYRDNWSARYSIGKILQHHDTLTKSIGDAKSTPHFTDADYDVFIATASGKVNDTVRQNSVIVGDNASRPCFLMVVYNKEFEGLSRMESHYSSGGKHLVTEPLQAVAVYYSIHNGEEVRAPFPAVATFARSTKPECRALNYQD
jgi:hypothetical protein